MSILNTLWRRSPAAPATAATAADNFSRALQVVLRHEGGLVNDPADPGGLTKFGISSRAHPGEDIAGMTMERAGEIYRINYWDKLRCGDMPYPVALCVFDCGVNQGVGRAARVLQGAVKVTPDGAIGPKTLAAIAARDPKALALEIQAQRMMLYAALPGWGRFGLGWTRRAFDVAGQAAGNL